MKTSKIYTVAKLVVVFFWIASISGLSARVAGTARNADWLAQKMAQLEQDKLMEDPEKRVEALASWFGVVAPAPIDEYEWALYRATQNSLLSIPGHALYYKNKIEELRSKVKSGQYDEEGRGNYIREYRDLQGAIHIIGHLPSAESVAVLGHFINDPEGRDGKTIIGTIHKEDDGFEVNCLNAMDELNRVGIANPPVDLKRPVTTDNMFEYVDKWKDWWEEIKSGKRTYRFIGSNIEYGPDGPASSEVIQRTQRNMKRDEERAAGHKKATPVADPTSVITQIGKPFSLAGILAACALVAGAVWYFLKGRRVV